MATLTGKTLGKYEVFERIGRGGMADVYKGRHERLDRTVAIKVLHAFLAEGDDFLARFEREARAVASLRHPHIVQVYDFDAEDDDLYMVMEYIGGGSLKDRLQKAAAEGRYLPLDTVKSILGQISDALDAAHAKGMLHRDVKPANVLLDESGRAFLADFGIARIVSTTQFTATGSLVGTPAYMSPEQGRGESIGPASDLYSLGVILYEMLTNTIPFDADTPLAIIHKQIHDPLPPIHDKRGDLPEAVETILERALAKDPARRYTSAKDLARAFIESVQLEVVEESSGEGVDEDQKATVVMEPDVEIAAFQPTTTMEPEIDAGAAAELPVAKHEHAPVEDVIEPGKRRTFNPALIGGAVIVVLVILALATGLIPTGGSTCDSIEGCAEAAQQARAEGLFEDALAFNQGAIERVSPDEEPKFARLWCEHGYINLELEHIDEAIGNFEQCAGWTHGDPDLQGIREEAEQMMRELSGG